MHKNLLFLLITGVIILTSSACKVTNDEDSVVDVVPVFDLDMVENLTNNRELTFIIESIELQECENFSVGNNLVKTTSDIKIRINDIVPPDDCISGSAPAQSTVKLGFLPLGRVFNLEFTIENTITNKGKLTILDNHYKMELESMDGFGQVVKKLNRIGDQLIWGYIAYDESDLSAIAANFQNDLMDIADAKILEEGYYGHFSVSPDAALELLQSPDYQHIKTFYFNYSADDQGLLDLLDNYRNMVNAGQMELVIFTARGDVF